MGLQDQGQREKLGSVGSGRRQQEPPPRLAHHQPLQISHFDLMGQTHHPSLWLDGHFPSSRDTGLATCHHVWGDSAGRVTGQEVCLTFPLCVRTEPPCGLNSLARRESPLLTRDDRLGRPDHPTSPGAFRAGAGDALFADYETEESTAALGRPGLD